MSDNEEDFDIVHFSDEKDDTKDHAMIGSTDTEEDRENTIGDEDARATSVIVTADRQIVRLSMNQNYEEDCRAYPFLDAFGQVSLSEREGGNFPFGIDSERKQAIGDREIHTDRSMTSNPFGIDSQKFPHPGRPSFSVGVNTENPTQLTPNTKHNDDNEITALEKVARERIASSRMSLFCVGCYAMVFRDGTSHSVKKNKVPLVLERMKGVAAVTMASLLCLAEVAYFMKDVAEVVGVTDEEPWVEGSGTWPSKIPSYYSNGDHKVCAPSPPSSSFYQSSTHWKDTLLWLNDVLFN